MSRRSGQIIARGEKKWLVRWFVSSGASGVRRYASKTIHGTKKDAQRALNEVLRSRDVGTYVSPTKVTVDDYLDRWLKDGAKGSSRTREGMRWALAKYVRPTIGRLRLDQLTALDVQAIVSSMSADDYSPRTVRIALGALRRALKQAVRWRLLVRNPADDIELPRKTGREMLALSAEQVAKFRQCADGGPHAVLFDLLLGSGMRPGEALSLRWQDLDARAGAISIRRALTWEVGADGGPKRSAVFLEPKTARSRRTIPLPASVIRELAAHRAVQAERAMKLGAAYDRDADLIFANEIGRPVDERNLVKRHFRPAVVAAGLDSRLRLYDLRHVHASLLLAAGESVKVVSERLGHASAAMTLDVYAHVLPGLQERATKRIEATIFGS